jgi:hypothetical protein
MGGALRRRKAVWCVRRLACVSAAHGDAAKVLHTCHAACVWIHNAHQDCRCLCPSLLAIRALAPRGRFRCTQRGASRRRLCPLCARARRRNAVRVAVHAGLRGEVKAGDARRPRTRARSMCAHTHTAHSRASRRVLSAACVHLWMRIPPAAGRRGGLPSTASGMRVRIAVHLVQQLFPAPVQVHREAGVQPQLRVARAFRASVGECTADGWRGRVHARLARTVWPLPTAAPSTMSVCSPGRSHTYRFCERSRQAQRARAIRLFCAPSRSLRARHTPRAAHAARTPSLSVLNCASARSCVNSRTSSSGGSGSSAPLCSSSLLLGGSASRAASRDAASPTSTREVCACFMACAARQSGAQAPLSHAPKGRPSRVGHARMHAARRCARARRAEVERHRGRQALRVRRHVLHHAAVRLVIRVAQHSARHTAVGAGAGARLALLLLLHHLHHLAVRQAARSVQHPLLRRRGAEGKRITRQRVGRHGSCPQAHAARCAHRVGHGAAVAHARGGGAARAAREQGRRHSGGSRGQ